MAREPKVNQEAPTAPQPRDPQGRVLDQWGLPHSGPARAAALATLKREDPRIDPTGWEVTPAASTELAPAASAPGKAQEA